MSNLDDKLREILTGCVNRAYDDMDSKSWHDPYSEPIAQIKQAFTDEGYKQYTIHTKITTLNGVVTTQHGQAIMTGQEWYDRFKKELTNIKPPDEYVGDVVAAAKRASGVFK